MDIFENYYYGFKYIRDHLGARSVSGWQIDPFGHSKGHAYIMR